MSEKGYTIDPCPGCGEKNYRKRKDLCPNCLNLMETGRMHNRLYSSLCNNDNFQEIEIPKGWSVPDISSRKLYNTVKFDAVTRSLSNLVELLTVQKGRRTIYGYMAHYVNGISFENIPVRDSNIHVIFKDDSKNYNRHYDHNAQAVINKDVLTALETLYSAIVETMAETEREAIDYGKNVLFMLNSGKITMDQFDKE